MTLETQQDKNSCLYICICINIPCNLKDSNYSTAVSGQLELVLEKLKSPTLSTSWPYQSVNITENKSHDNHRYRIIIVNVDT